MALRIGLIGCGVISGAYLKAAPGFPVLDMAACADVRPEAAAATASEHGLRAMSVEDLLGAGDIDVVLNLTTPAHHRNVDVAALEAGKHVYSEKPLALDLAEGRAILDAASANGLRVGCAPDTFLGGSHQAARAAVDDGRIGQVLSGTATMMVPGHEAWHPNPDFYYQAGGGPLFDMGPYYLTALVNLLGPVARVTAIAGRGYRERSIGSGPRAGETVAVEVDTHVAAFLGFASGAQVTLTTSFDVRAHGHAHIELYGTGGSLRCADPNRFDGNVMVTPGGRDAEWTAVDNPFRYADGNYRILGLADMAEAILEDRPHRASLDLSLHVLAVMDTILTAAEQGRTLDVPHPAGRPAPLDPARPVGAQSSISDLSS